MEFCFSGDLDKLKEFVDYESMENVSNNYAMEKTEIRFFTDTLPKEKDLLIEMKADGSFDAEYDVFGGRYVFVVSPDAEKLKDEIKRAETKAMENPFFPMDWEEDGRTRYVLSDVLCFENMLDMAKFLMVFMNSLNEKGFFKLDAFIFGMEFFSDSSRVKVIKSCNGSQIEEIKDLHGTLAVFYCNKEIDGLEFMSERTKGMHEMLLNRSDTKNHFLQMFYVNDDTDMEYFYWKEQD